MGFYPFNPNLEQEMQTSVSGINVDRGFIMHLLWDDSGEAPSLGDPVVADADGVHAAITCSGDSTVTVTTNITNPDAVRNITATAGGTAGDIKAVQVTITGTDMNDAVISEALPAFTVDTAGTVTGSKAFKTVTSIAIPAMDGSGATVTIGWGDKLGLPVLLSNNTVLFAFLNGSKEGTAPTVAVSATAISSNTIDLNSALDGNDVEVYLIA